MSTYRPNHCSEWCKAVFKDTWRSKPTVTRYQTKTFMTSKLGAITEIKHRYKAFILSIFSKAQTQNIMTKNISMRITKISTSLFRLQFSTGHYSMPAYTNTTVLNIPATVHKENNKSWSFPPTYSLLYHVNSSFAVTHTYTVSKHSHFIFSVCERTYIAHTNSMKQSPSRAANNALG